jgi:hypothetical protein
MLPGKDLCIFATLGIDNYEDSNALIFVKKQYQVVNAS